MNLYKNIFLAATGKIGQIQDSKAVSAFWPTVLGLLAVAMLMTNTFRVVGYMLVWPLGFFYAFRRQAPALHPNEWRFGFVLLGGTAITATMAAFGMPLLIVILHSLVNQMLALRAGRLPSNADGEQAMPSITPEEAVVLRAMRAGPASAFMESGPVIGTFKGATIPDWFVDSKGRKLVFVSTCEDPSKTPPAADEVLVSPGLLYKLEAAQ
jgi:hypothetical protein